MRRSAALVATLTTALTTALVLAALGAGSAASATTMPGGPGPSALPGASGATTSAPSSAAARAQAEQALRLAGRLVGAGDAVVPDRTGPDPAGRDATAALLQLRLTMHALPTADRRQAEAILSRPTDHPDPVPDGGAYTVKSKRMCAGHICVHWVTSTADKAPNQAWVDQMLRLMNNVWSYEVGKLGYHPPISDGRRGGGGSGKLDVYLKDIGAQGQYGITVAEKRTSYNKRLYSSYIVIDNDFARSQFGTKPISAARVTAAHEFFHTIQYAYDTREDNWLKEATATWMEDQFADSVNDNRQYLPYSQLAHPGTPLDTQNGNQQYGNFVFFAYLSQHYGRSIVKSIWKHAAAFAGGGHEYSAQAIRSALVRHSGMTKVFASYAAANTQPAHFYTEGAAYPTSPSAQTVTLTQAARSTPWETHDVRHLASLDVKARPGADLSGRRWMLRVQVEGPRRSKSPAVAVLVTDKSGQVDRHLMRLSGTGTGRVSVSLNADAVSRVTVTLANASTRFRCGQGSYSCNGAPVVARSRFHLELAAYRR